MADECVSITELPVHEVFSSLQKSGDFSIVPCENKIDFTDSQRFAKLNLGPEQTLHINAFLQQAPNLLASGALANAYTVRFPEGLPHTLTALRQGGFGSMIRGESGKFVGSASFYSMTAQAALMGAFTAMSVASGQYFLSQINSEMRLMNLKLDEILAFLYGDKKAELMAEMHFIQYAYQNYASIMDHDVQRQATLVSLQNAKKVAMKDIEFYISDLDAAVSNRANDFDALEKLTSKTLLIQESLSLAQQLYVMSSVMEVYYSQNLDISYLRAQEQDMLIYIDKCDKRTLGSFSKLEGQVNVYKPKPWEKVDKTTTEKRLHDITDQLNVGEESSLRKAVRSALHAADKPAEYYLTGDGQIYAKVG